MFSQWGIVSLSNALYWFKSWTYLWSLVLAICLQTRGLEQKFEHERDELRARAADSEKKLQERTQELSLAEQALAARRSEFETLQANMKELEELREMKEVCT